MKYWSCPGWFYTGHICISSIQDMYLGRTHWTQHRQHFQDVMVVSICLKNLPQPLVDARRDRVERNGYVGWFSYY